MANCEHPKLKQFTFSDGATIKMCPDCTFYDNERQRILALPLQRRKDGG